MKTLVLSIILAGVSVGTASAETFTFTSKSTVANQIVAPTTGGPPVAAVFISGTSETIFASGKKGSNIFNCAQWSSTPGFVFMTVGACTFVDQNGDKASIISGCDFTNKDQSQQNCWGGLTGLTGAVAGKSGTISWHATNNADGKSGSSAGVGQWN